MALLKPEDADTQIGIEADCSIKNVVGASLDVPNRADLRLRVQELLGFNKARLKSDPKLAEVMKSLEN